MPINSVYVTAASTSKLYHISWNGCVALWWIRTNGTRLCRSRLPTVTIVHLSIPRIVVLIRLVSAPHPYVLSLDQMIAFVFFKLLLTDLDASIKYDFFVLLYFLICLCFVVCFSSRNMCGSGMCFIWHAMS